MSTEPDFAMCELMLDSWSVSPPPTWIAERILEERARWLAPERPSVSFDPPP
jgi:hypothetical protein